MHTRPEMNHVSCLELMFATDAFLARCWPSRHRVAHGPLSRLGQLASLPPLFDLNLLLATHADRIRVALPDKRDEHSSVEVDAARASQSHREGLALIFNQVERFLPPVQQWLESLRRELGLPLKCNPRAIVYASPAGSGNSPHFDANANFVIQVRGCKRWRIAPNRHVADPTDRWAMNEDELSDELEGYVEGPLPTLMPADAETFDLVPGSVLFVPRGYWHQTEAEEDTLALNFTFGQPTRADQLLAALRTRLLKDPAWRALATGLQSEVGHLLEQLGDQVAGLEPSEVHDALDPQTTWLLVPRAFLRIDEARVTASLGAGEFSLDTEPALHPVLEWIARQRTPFSLEQAALYFPEVVDALPELLRTLRSKRLLGRHRGRPSEDRD